MSRATDLLDAPDPDDSPSSHQPLSIRSPAEIIAFEFDDSDLILGDRLLAKGQSMTILGEGGIGKSRLVLQLAVCCLTGLDWLTLVTRGVGLRWLIIQTENSNRRLSADLRALKAWVNDDAKWKAVESGLLIHTLENDDDTLLALEDVDSRKRVEEAVVVSKSDVVAWDPLKDFTNKDLNSDSDMTNLCRSIATVSKKEKPDRATIVSQHARTGRAGASSMSGFDRSSFGRNSKALHNWTRGAINIAPGTTDNQTLVFSCGKCSNGLSFETFAATMENGVYHVDNQFDIPAWEEEIIAPKSSSNKFASDRVRHLCEVSGSTKEELSKNIIADFGVSKATSYRYIDKSVRSKIINWSDRHERYFRG